MASPECFAVAKQLPAKRCPIKPSRLQTKVQTTLKPMAYTLVTSTSHHPAAHNIIGAYSGVTNQTTLGKILFEAKKCPDALHRNIRLLTGVNLCVYTNACMSTNVYIRMYVYIYIYIYMHAYKIHVVCNIHGHQFKSSHREILNSGRSWGLRFSSSSNKCRSEA